MAYAIQVWGKAQSWIRLLCQYLVRQPFPAILYQIYSRVSSALLRQLQLQSKLFYQ